MRSTKANIAGLTSSVQQAEMKSILAGTWPPLKPLPVFKYETVEYRATVDFDKKRGEWVCRKTSLPSNTVQELRGGLREITLALPHDEGEAITEEAEQPEQELEKDANRRLQAIHSWRENYESGSLYFELRNHLVESHQIELDDSLRLSLTARQLQFNPKNVAHVFDTLLTAGGRFATLIEFAKRKRARQGTEPQPQGQRTTSEAEPAIDHDEQHQENGSCEFEVNRVVRDQPAPEHCTDSDELPALSIKNVLPEQQQTSLAEGMAAPRASQELESRTSEIVDTDSAWLLERLYQEERQRPAFTELAVQDQTAEMSAEHETSSSHSPALKVSAFQVAVFAALFFFAVLAFTIGLRVGLEPFASRQREAPKSIPAMDLKSLTPADQTEESASRIVPAVKSANEFRNAGSLGQAMAPETKSQENTPGSESDAKARSTGSDSSEPGSAKGQVSLAHSEAIEPGSPAPRRVIPTATPRLPRFSTILVTRPDRGSQPFWVSFPQRTIAATSSLAMSSELSVLVATEPGLSVAHKPARLEAGDLVSFVWPRYPRQEDRNGLAETIRVRTTIGQLGQVLEVKFLSGANSLLPATKAAIRQWRYSPTLLDKRPLQVQQDVTIEFRPTQSSTQVSRKHPSHN